MCLGIAYRVGYDSHENKVCQDWICQKQVLWYEALEKKKNTINKTSY